MKLIETQDNPYPVRTIAGFTVIQGSPILSFLISDDKILRFQHPEGILSDSTIEKWVAKNAQNSRPRLIN